MKNNQAFANYPRNVHLDFKGRLFAFSDNNHHHMYFPFPEKIAESKLRLMSQKMKMSTMSIGRIYSLDPYQRLIEDSIEEVKLEFHRWRKLYGLSSVKIYDVEIYCRLIKTSSTYIYAFQLKNLVESKTQLNDMIEFTYHKNNQQTENQRTIKSSEYHRSPKRDDSFVNINQAVSNKLAEMGNSAEDKDKKVMKIAAEIYSQQVYFEEEQRKNKKFEPDMSQSLNSDSDSANPITNSRTTSDNTKQVTYSAGTTSIYSISNELKQGGDEEILTNIPNLKYYPQSFYPLRLFLVCLAALSILVTITVLIYDANFNKWMVSSTESNHLLTYLDNLVLKDSVLVGVLYLNQGKSNRQNLTNEILKTLASDVAKLKLYVGKMRTDESVISTASPFISVCIL